MRTAVMSTAPLTGSTFVAATSVMAVPDGATSGILLHEPAVSAAPARTARTTADGRDARQERSRACGTMRVAKDSTVMKLAGQGGPNPPRGDLDERGYIMVALLIAMAVTVVWMGAALPSWRQQVIRERE